MKPSARITELETAIRREGSWAMSDLEVRVEAMKRYLDEQWEAREAMKRNQPQQPKRNQARA